MALGVVSALGTALVFWLGAVLVIRGALTIGTIVARAAYLDPELVVCPVDLSDVREARRKLLLKRDEKPEAIWRSLERIVRAAED